MMTVLESQAMGRPKSIDEPQTQVRITRKAYEAVRKAAEIKKMTAPAYISMIALQAANADILEDAKKTVEQAQAHLREAEGSQKDPPTKPPKK